MKKMTKLAALLAAILLLTAAMTGLRRPEHRA